MGGKQGKGPRKGGGRPHMAQASIGEPEKAEKALAEVTAIVRPMIEQAKA